MFSSSLPYNTTAVKKGHVKALFHFSEKKMFDDQAFCGMKPKNF